MPPEEERRQPILVILRVREAPIRQRTRLIRAIEDHLAAFGIVRPERAHRIGIPTATVENPEDGRLPAVARHALRLPVVRLREMTEKIERIDAGLAGWARAAGR